MPHKRNAKAMMLPPFGFRVDPNRKQRLMVYEPEATIVRQMFQLATLGGSLGKIAELFNTAGIPYPRERLHEDYAELFFRYMRWENPEIEPIIDRSLFEEVQEKLQRRVNRMTG